MNKKHVFLTLIAGLAVFSISNSSVAAESKATKGVGAKSVEGKSTKDKPADPKEKPAVESKDKAAKGAGDSKGKAAQPSAEELAAKVLDPSRFFGQAMFGYAAAKNAPVIMSKLFCYCGCDITDSHNNLLDCFTSIHGVDCHICQEEAVLALKMSRDGTSDSDIQKTIDEKYMDKYPFEEESPTYKRYKAGRLYIAGGGQSDSSAKSGAKFGEGTAGPEAPGEVKKWEPKLKPGKSMSQCCSGDDHKKESKKNEKK